MKHAAYGEKRAVDDMDPEGPIITRVLSVRYQFLLALKILNISIKIMFHQNFYNNVLCDLLQFILEWQEIPKDTMLIR